MGAENCAWICCEGFATNVSPGLPEVESQVTFRGDRNRMYVFTKVGDFTHCWSVHTGDAIPAPSSGRQQNPFRRGKKAKEGVLIPGEDVGQQVLLQPYVFSLKNPDKRVQLFLNSDNVPLAINVDGVEGDASIGARIHGWSTEDIPDQVFEPDDHHCGQPEFVEDAETLAHWEILKIFFPGDVDDVQQEQRRLFVE